MQVTIETLGPRGDGYLTDQSGRIYVDRSVPGDILEIKLKKTKDGSRQAEITNIITPSKHRNQADCQYYEICGGCTMQHLTRGFYCDWKQNTVKEALARQSINPRKILQPVFIGGGNRRRVTFSAMKQKQGVLLGYHKRRSKFISDIDTCLVADPSIMELRPVLKQSLGAILQTGKVVDVMVQKINSIFDIVLTGLVGKKGEPDLTVMEMAAELMLHPSIARISWRAALHDEIEIIVEKEPLRKTFGQLDVALPPACFLQPTPEGETALINAVMALLPAKGKFADLFCGCGTFAGAMLKNGSVTGFESNQNSITALNSAAANIGAAFSGHQRDLFREPLCADELNNYDAIVFDPPRAGAKKQVGQLANSNVKTLIGVSCNPATFARDARILSEGGYQLETVQMFDQFYGSHHVEIVGAFSKNT